MQVNSINNQNFGARLAGDFEEIISGAINNGLKRSKATEIKKQLLRMLPDSFTVTMQKPQAFSVTGKVFVENNKGGYDMAISPVILNRRNAFAKYAEAAKILSELDYSKVRGITTIA